MLCFVLHEFFILVFSFGQLVRKYPKTMKASPFLTPRPISAPINSVLNLIALHSPALEHTSRNHSAVHSALGTSNATSSSVSFSSEHQHEILKFPSVDENPESLSSNDSNNGRANKLQNSESTVHREDIFTTHIGQEKAGIKPLPRVEDTTANNALAGCKQALSLPTRHDALLKSYPTIPPLVSPLSPSTALHIPTSSHGTDSSDKRVTQSSDKPTALILNQPSCEVRYHYLSSSFANEHVKGGDSPNVDMDLSDDEANSIPVLELSRNGHEGLEPTVMGTAQIGCQDQSLKLTSAELTSTINGPSMSATIASESSQVSMLSQKVPLTPIVRM